MMFFLPKHLRTYIFKLSRKAALYDYLEEHLTSRPRFKRFRDGPIRDYMEVRFQLSSHKTMEIVHSCIYEVSSVAICKKDEVRLVLYAEDETLVCNLYATRVSKYRHGESEPVGIWHTSFRNRYRVQVPISISPLHMLA